MLLVLVSLHMVLLEIPGWEAGGPSKCLQVAVFRSNGPLRLLAELEDGAAAAIVPLVV